MNKRTVGLLLLSVLLYSSIVHGWETYNTDNGYFTILEIRNEIKAYLLNNSYSPRQVTTHPWITIRALKYLEDSDSSWNVLTPDEKSMIASGSIEEDFDMVGSSDSNHAMYTHIGEGSTLGLFYPVQGSGVNVEAGFDRAYNHYYTGGYDINNLDSSIGRLDLIGPLDRTNAIYWALNSTINYRNLKYIRDNPLLSKMQKLQILGNVIHLLEDMASPPHPNGDPHPVQYSEETALNKIGFTDHENFGGSVSITDSLPSYLTLPAGAEYWEYFEKLSKFTREYFFSENRMFMDWHDNTLRDGLGARGEKIIDYKYLYRDNEGNIRGYYVYTNKGRKLAKCNNMLGFTVATGGGLLPSTWDDAVIKKYIYNIDELVSMDSWRELWPITVKYVAGFTKDFYTKEILSSQQPSVDTLAATSITASGATLNGSINPNGLATNYWFEYGTSSTLVSYSSTSTKSAGAGTTSQSFSEPISGLQAGTTYYFRVAASSGGTARGAIQSFSTTSGASTTWSKTYGGNSYDSASSVQQTTDGGYIVAGWTRSFGGGDVDSYLLKLDGQGNLLWQKTYGGLGDDWANSVQQTSDGGYIIAGATTSFGAGGEDFYLVKTDGQGNLQWQKTFGGSGDEWANSVQQTSDGGYIIAGRTLSSSISYVYIIKADGQGNLVWQKTIVGASAISIQQTTDGGYIMTGVIFSDNLERVDLIKTDGQGNLVWQKTFAETGHAAGHSVQQTSDGGYIIAGWARSISKNVPDVYLIKTDNQGNLLWQRTYGGAIDSWGTSVRQTSDGGYIIAGNTYSFGAGDSDAYLIKTDVQGNLVWQKTYGGFAYDIANSVRQTSDGGYIIAGSTSSYGIGIPDFYHVYLVKTDANGNVL